ncbi:MAG TPA: FliM/FliN family flagellar motor switch protein [Bryobacteraceae bacterium]|nr:FliM/FliN family flagellar motor switch protein [Bryobacteraceae bacterium]
MTDKDMDKPNVPWPLDRMQCLLDVPLALRVVLDQRLMSFGELLGLNAGSLIRLSRPTGENIDIYAGEMLIGWGEILLIDGNVSVRVADLRDASGHEGPEGRITRAT